MQLFKLAATLVAAASAVTAFEITKPNPDEWWVAKSTNILEWDCKASDNAQQYTVLIQNKDVPTLVNPLAIIAQINNFDCSIIVTNNQADQPAATGYQLLLADIFNSTNVYATSQPFEIKPLGSLYPSQQNGGKGPGSASGSSGPKPTSGSSSDEEGSALGLASSTFGVAAAAAAAFAALF